MDIVPISYQTGGCAVNDLQSTVITSTESQTNFQSRSPTCQEGYLKWLSPVDELGFI
jgi:hypothetical protein